MPKEFFEPPEGFNPFGDLLGIAFTAYGNGRSRCELEARRELINPHGVLHGGVVYSMVDFGMGAALYSLIEEKELCATVEIKITYLRSVKEGKLICESEVVDRRRRIAVLESEVRNRDEVVAKALGTFYVYDAG